MAYRLICDNKRYSFSLMDNGTDVFDSRVHFILSHHVDSDYKYAWQACSAAKKMERKRPLHVEAMKKWAMEDLEKPVILDISAEEMIFNHYNEMIDIFSSKTKDPEEDDVEDIKTEGHMIYDELRALYEAIEDDEDKRKVKKLVSVLKKIMRPYGGIKKKEEREESVSDELGLGAGMGAGMGAMAKSAANIIEYDEEFQEDVLTDFAEKVCEAIEKSHPNCVFDIDVEGQVNEIYVSDKTSSAGDQVAYAPILVASFNDNFNLRGLYPVGNLKSVYPYHNAEFFEKYWKPIVNSIGHFLFEDNDALVVSQNIPDFKSGSSKAIKAWDVKKGKDKEVKLEFKGEEENESWFIEDEGKDLVPAFATPVRMSSAQNKESVFFGKKIVICTDNSLESIFKQLGEIIEIIPHADYVELDVNFGEELGVVRLTEDKVEIVN